MPLHLLRDVRLWWFRLLKDTVNSSSDSICLFGVELSYGCFESNWLIFEISAAIMPHDGVYISNGVSGQRHILATVERSSRWLQRYIKTTSFLRGILGNSLEKLPVRRDLFRRQVAQRLKKEIETGKACKYGRVFSQLLKPFILTNATICCFT